MANVFATRTGVWSATATWNTSALPTTVDDVYSNNFTVYVDNSYQVLSVRNLSAASINAGGSFILNNGVSLSANVGGGGTSTLACVRHLSAAPSSVSLYGNLSAFNTAVTEPVAISNESSGTFFVSGNSIGCSKNATGTTPGAAYIRNTSTGTLNLLGTYFTNLIAGGLYYCINNTNSTGTVNITGDITGGGALANGTCVYNVGRLNVLGNVISTLGTGGGSRGIQNASTGIVSITGNVIAGHPLGAGVITSGPRGIDNSGILTVYGNVSGGTGTGSNLAHGIDTGAALNLPVTVYGNVVGSNTVASGYGINSTGGGQIYVFGNVISSLGIAILTNNSLLIDITGNVFGGTGSSIRGIQYGAAGRININGNVFGGSGSSASGIFTNGASFITISGLVSAGTGNLAYGAENTATGYMSARTAAGNAFGLNSTGINTAPGIFGSQTGTTIVGSIQCGPRGQWPTAGNVFLLPQQNSTMTFETSAFQDVTLFTSFSANITPPVSSVRLGTKYNLNDYTGTCAIPSISSVLQGVAVDDSIGIAALQPQAVWSVQTSAIDTNSLGGRLKESATVQSFGQLLTAFNM